MNAERLVQLSSRRFQTMGAGVAVAVGIAVGVGVGAAVGTGVAVG